MTFEILRPEFPSLDVAQVSRQTMMREYGFPGARRYLVYSILTATCPSISDVQYALPL